MKEPKAGGSPHLLESLLHKQVDHLTFWILKSTKYGNVCPIFETEGKHCRTL
jgi:hypothetical protein